MKEKNKGITLIALIVTIIIMLILATVTIKIATAGGLFDKAWEAVGKTQNAIDAEQNLYNEIDDYMNGKTSPIHNWTRAGDTFTCSHCNKSYTMGDEVNYTATGKTSTTITAEKSGLDKYYEDYVDYSEYPLDANVNEEGEQTIERQDANWVVLGIEDTNGDGVNETLLITTEDPVFTATNKGLYFYGAAGYNNGPREIKRICGELYSNSEYGKARGMTIKDVNRALNYTPLGGLYTNSENKIQTTGNLTTKLRDTPTWNSIKENHYTPDGANTEETLGNYELNGYVYGLNNEGTALVNGVNETTSPVTEIERKTIFGEANDYFYWLASRGVCAYFDCAYFGSGHVNYGDAISCDQFFVSDGGGIDGSAGLRPVVSLRSKLPGLK